MVTPRPRLAVIALRLLDRLLQRLVPVRARRVCYLSVPDYTDNAFYLYRRAVSTRTDLEHVWLVDDPGVRERIHREFDELVTGRDGHGHQVKVVRKLSLSGYLHYLTSRTVFHTHGAYMFSNRAHRRHVVALWHGMPIKAIGRLNRVSTNPKPTFATAAIATSQLYRYIMATSFGLDAHDVEVTGHPRCDAFHHPAARGTELAEIRRRVGVSEGQRLVLWLPTHRAGGRSFVDDLPAWGVEALERACAESSCTLVVKLHPFDALNDSSDGLEGMQHMRLLRSDEWLREGIQLYDLIAASDGLLTDISSVLIDYIITGRPIGIFAFDEERYDREPVLPYELFFTSSRFDVLEAAKDVQRFFAAVRDGQEVHPPPSDVAAALHEHVDGPSAELVLARYGL